MPRSVQAFRQNAQLTHNPNNTITGDPSQAIDDGSDYFKVPSFLDLCSPVTQGTQNPFMSGLNTMGEGTNTSGVPGQTGNILSGLQIFSDTLCGMALGGSSMTVSQALGMARQLRAAGGDLGETVEAIRQLRATIGIGTSPQSVLSGVQDTSNAVNSHPFTGGLLSMGGSSTGNQFIDALNGLTSFLGALCGIGTGSTDVSATTPASVISSAQSMTSGAHLLLSGRFKANANGNDLFSAGAAALRRNISLHFGNQALSTAQSVALQQQNLLVSDDFSASTTVVGDAHWSWDGTDGSPGTNVKGCAVVACNGTQPPLVSSEIPVVAGEEIEVACQIKWSGLTYTGDSPLVLAVEKYRLMKDPAGSGQNVYTDIGWYDVYTVPTPGTASSGWVGVAGTYTVETGVDQLRFRLQAKPNATAGTVKFDAASFLKLSLIASECVPFTGETVDNIVTKLYGSIGAGFSQNDAAVALANTAASLSSVNARLAALEAEGHTGALAGDDFNWTGEILSSGNWGGVYSPGSFGNYQSNGTTVGFVESTYAHVGTEDCRFNWIGADSVSDTDYQLVQCVISTPPGYNPSYGTAYMYVFGRVSSDWLNYIMLKIGGDGTYQVIRGVSGVETVMSSGTCPVPGTGSTVTLYCGDAPTTAPRKFTAKIGSQTISSFTESGTASQLGASYRGWGFGGLYDKYRLAPLLGNPRSVFPPIVDQWIGMDQ